jgi:hypothetical protein
VVRTEPESSNGVVYRLVVTVDGREAIFNGAPFRDRKRAIAQVAAAVRHYARQAEVRRVALQRGAVSTAGTAVAHSNAADRAVAHSNAADRAVARGAASCPGRLPGIAAWTTIARWDNDVVQRILRQDGVPPRTPVVVTQRHSDTVAATPTCAPLPPAGVAPAAPPTPAAAGAPRTPHVGRVWPKSQRWPVLVTAGLLALVWIVLTLLLTGGHPGGLFASATASQPAVVGELPVEAPARPAPPAEARP